MYSPLRESSGTNTANLALHIAVKTCQNLLFLIDASTTAHRRQSTGLHGTSAFPHEGSAGSLTGGAGLLPRRTGSISPQRSLTSPTASWHAGVLPKAKHIFVPAASEGSEVMSEVSEVRSQRRGHNCTCQYKTCHGRNMLCIGMLTIGMAMLEPYCSFAMFCR